MTKATEPNEPTASEGETTGVARIQRRRRKGQKLRNGGGGEISLTSLQAGTLPAEKNEEENGVGGANWRKRKRAH